MKRFRQLLLAAMLLGTGACAGGPAGADGSRALRREKAGAEDALALEGCPSGRYALLDTACGKIRGIAADGYRVFRGVRYATARRWEDPVPVTYWDGEYDATRFGPRCSQYKGFFGTEDSPINQFYLGESLLSPHVEFSEDCLNLNIWTPEQAENCPVLVFIHGGAFMTGGNGEPYIDGEVYARQGVILVSINYRLNAFTVVYGDGFTGNCALTDQAAALRWIRENIGDYGGDPTRVTVMGESAGAVSVQNLLISPLAGGLMDAAILLSGGGDLSSLLTPTTPDKIAPIWEKVKAAAGVDHLSRLQDLPGGELYRMWLQAAAATPEAAGAANNPMVEGRTLTGSVADALAAGSQADVRCIFSVLSEDMWPHTLYTQALEYGVRSSQAGKAPVYLSFIDRRLPGENPFGAFHAADLWYVFGTLYRNWRPFDDVDYRISRTLIDIIVQFVKTGNPNGSGLPRWEPVTPDNRRSLRFGDPPPEMYEPSLEALAQTQRTKPAFPHQ